MFSLPAGASTDVDALLRQLREAEAKDAQRIENRIMNAWSKSGSATMDLLLKRGRDALEVGDADTALGHFTALTDHAPGFAEGWHGLALAYFQLQMLGPAMDALEHALALNPRHFGAMRGVGAILEQTGQDALAYRAYMKVLEVHPQDAAVKEAAKRLEAKVTGKAL